MNEADPAEQRRFPRFSYSIPIKYKERSKAVPSYTVTRDISIGGVKILASNFMPRGTELNLEVELPRMSMVNTSAAVTWSNRISHSDNYLCGLRFTDIDETNKKNISDLVNYAFSH